MGDIMNRILKKAFVFTFFTFVVMLNSCENGMFATSWGTAFKRNPGNVKVTASNVNDLLKNARGDQELSKAIFDKTKELAKNTTGQEKADLQAAAITAAKQAVALDMLIISNAGKLLKAAGEEGGVNNVDIEGILNDILDGAKENKIKDISAGLGEIFSGDIDKYVPGGPRFKTDNAFFANTVRDSDLVNLVITIILGIVVRKEESMDDYLNSWKQGDKKIDGTGLEGDELVAAATFNLLKERGSESELYKALSDIFDKGTIK
jgi:hypothetical protein